MPLNDYTESQAPVGEICIKLFLQSACTCGILIYTEIGNKGKNHEIRFMHHRLSGKTVGRGH